jgi:hypothetical protein
VYVVCARGDALLPLRIALQARLHLCTKVKNYGSVGFLIFYFCRFDMRLGNHLYLLAYIFMCQEICNKM